VSASGELVEAKGLVEAKRSVVGELDSWVPSMGVVGECANPSAGVAVPDSESDCERQDLRRQERDFKAGRGGGVWVSLVCFLWWRFSSWRRCSCFVVNTAGVCLLE